MKIIATGLPATIEDYQVALNAAFAGGEAFGKAQQRTWIGLTDEEMSEAMNYWSDASRSAYGGAFAADGEYVDMVSTWRYIEAKLKQKNGIKE